MFIRTQSNGSRTYLLIVDNQRVDGKVMQRVLFRLGRLDQPLAGGQLAPGYALRELAPQPTGTRTNYPEE